MAPSFQCLCLRRPVLQPSCVLLSWKPKLGCPMTGQSNHSMDARAYYTQLDQQLLGFGLLSGTMNLSFSLSLLQKLHAIKSRYQKWSRLDDPLTINRTSRKFPRQSNPSSENSEGKGLLQK